jgi:hypothetical protein
MTVHTLPLPRHAKSVAFEPPPSAEDRLRILLPMRERAERDLRETNQLIAKVKGAPAKPEDLYAYEHEQRRKIAARDWARVHVAGDRREPLDWVSRPRRFILDALSLKARKG